MHFDKYIERLEYLDFLIRNKQTGSPEILANKLNVSKSVIYDLLRIMKKMNAPIYYDNFEQSYSYYKQVKLVIKFIEIK